MQAKLVQLEALGERVSGLAGVNPTEIKRRAGPRRRAGVAAGRSSLEELQAHARRPGAAHRPAHRPVHGDRVAPVRPAHPQDDGAHPAAGERRPVGSAFGWRIDPFTGRSALHTGLDFQADTGTPILAAAGGVVVAQETHSAYGNMVEVDHGNDLITRYAHASQAAGARRATWSSAARRSPRWAPPAAPPARTCTSRCWSQGVPQDPQKFLRRAARHLALAPARSRCGRAPATPARRPPPPGKIGGFAAEPARLQRPAAAPS